MISKFCLGPGSLHERDSAWTWNSSAMLRAKKLFMATIEVLKGDDQFYTSQIQIIKQTILKI